MIIHQSLTCSTRRQGGRAKQRGGDARFLIMATERPGNRKERGGSFMVGGVLMCIKSALERRDRGMIDGGKESERWEGGGRERRQSEECY